jgi:FAD:protein FMN transferase
MTGGGDAPVMHRFAHRAMACIYEILVPGGDQALARDAASAAFQELDRLEKVLSRFHAYGDVGRINAAPAGQTIVVDIETTDCLAVGRRVWQDTDGAFDVTAGKPDDGLAGPAARAIGMGLLEIDEDAHTVRRLDPTVQVDLGAIGKGYALDRMAEVLAEWDIAAALLHSGTSTALALGVPPSGQAGWRLALRDPTDEGGEPLGWVVLSGLAFGGSATTHQRHIVDPRRRQAVPGDRAAWAVAASAAEADALTTALCVMEIGEIAGYCLRREETSCIVAFRQSGRWRLRQYGPPRLVSGAGLPEEGA